MPDYPTGGNDKGLQLNFVCNIFLVWRMVFVSTAVGE